MPITFVCLCFNYFIESSFKSFPVKISSFLSVCKECQGSLLNQMWRMRTLMASKIAGVNSQNMKWHFVKWRVQYALSVPAGVAHLLNMRSTAISFDNDTNIPHFYCLKLTAKCSGSRPAWIIQAEYHPSSGRISGQSLGVGLDDFFTVCSDCNLSARPHVHCQPPRACHNLYSCTLSHSHKEKHKRQKYFLQHVTEGVAKVLILHQ